MKKLLFIALLLTSTAAMAQTAPPAGAPAVQGNSGPSPEQREQKFEEHKAKILEHISQHLAEVQKRQACVQAAKDRDALKVCFPNSGAEGGKGFGGPGGDEGHGRH